MFFIEKFFIKTLKLKKKKICYSYFNYHKKEITKNLNTNSDR